MKTKHFLLLVLFVSISSLFAQIEKGSQLSSGSLSINGHNMHPKRFTVNGTSIISRGNGFQTSFNFSHLVGVGKNWMIGAAAQFSYGNQLNSLERNDSLINRQVNNAYKFGASFVATKFIPIHEKWYIYLGQSLGYTYEEQKQTQKNYATSASTYNPKYHIINYNLSPGIMYFLKPQWAIFANFGGLGLNYETKQKMIDYQLSLTNGIGLGVAYMWPNKGAK